MSLTIFAGSVEFVAVNMLLGAFEPLHAFTITLMINVRHLFYGISMLDKYKGTGMKKIYLIFGMCDESFSINYAADIPKDVDQGWFMFFVKLLNHFYWFSGAILGGIFGSLIKFNTEGLDFVMTAMFVVIFMEQWMKDKEHSSGSLGLLLSAVCLYVFGADSFIIPAMVVTCAGCGASMVKKSSSAGGKKYYYYVCSNNKETKECSSHRIPVGKLEESVLKLLKVHISNILDLQRIMDKIASVPFQELDIKELEKHRAEKGRNRAF